MSAEGADRVARRGLRAYVAVRRKTLRVVMCAMLMACL